MIVQRAVWRSLHSLKCLPAVRIPDEVMTRRFNLSGAFPSLTNAAAYCRYRATLRSESHYIQDSCGSVTLYIRIVGGSTAFPTRARDRKGGFNYF